MAQLLYIANINSPHILEWLELLEANDALLIATIERGELQAQSFDFRYLGVISPPKVFDNLPKLLRYLILGLILRYRSYDGFLQHAHNASGYGLSALISGKEYIVTTYGSEIYNMERRSTLYRALIRKVVKTASAVTASAPSMAYQLRDYWPELSGRVYSFSLGVKAAFLKERKTDAPKHIDEPKIWISNRRMHPLYGIVEIVKGFTAYKRAGGRGKLYLLEGDADTEYAKRVRQEAKGTEDIEIIAGFISTSTLIPFLDHADYSISIPETDQLSSSILEAMACSCIPIVRDLYAYRDIRRACILLEPNASLVESLERAFWRTENLPFEEIDALRMGGRALVMEQYSKKRAKEFYRGMLDKRSSEDWVQ